MSYSHTPRGKTRTHVLSTIFHRTFGSDPRNSASITPAPSTENNNNNNKNKTKYSSSIKVLPLEGGKRIRHRSRKLKKNKMRRGKTARKHKN